MVEMEINTEGTSGKILLVKSVLTTIAVFCLLFVSTPSSAADDRETGEQPPTDEMVERPTEGAAQLQLDEAVELARQRIKEDPSSVKEKIVLGYLLVEQGSNAEAEKIFDEVLSAHENNHEALTGKGIVLAGTGREQEAEQFFQKALILNPNPVRTYYELGFLYEKKGEFDKANTQYKKGIEKFIQGRK